jgi:hypothetical protein
MRPFLCLIRRTARQCKGKRVQTVATLDYYAMLGVRRDADERKIKNTFRLAAPRGHPDKNAV